jgi:hypothetical protein
MSDWIPYERWQDCVRMERPGYVFEVANDRGRSLFTPCTVPLRLPFDWTTPPTRFRLVAEPPPRRSSPIPAPQKTR